METKTMGLLYQKIANLIVNMIPEEWDKVLLYSEIRDGYSRVFFYYYPQGTVSPTYSLDITDKFQINKTQFNKLEDELYDCFSELFEEFKIQEQEPWTSLTYSLDNTGKMNINYRYEDISQISSVEKREKWEAEYLVSN
jgi:uncharacterized protein (TIGR01741 family)